MVEASNNPASEVQMSVESDESAEAHLISRVPGAGSSDRAEDMAYGIADSMPWQTEGCGWFK